MHAFTTAATRSRSPERIRSPLARHALSNPRLGVANIRSIRSAEAASPLGTGNSKIATPPAAVATSICC